MSEKENNQILKLSHLIFNNEQYLIELKSHADISYRIVADITIENKTAEQSIFDGSIFRNSFVTNTNLSRGDFKAVIFEKCFFKDVSFSSSDIQSSIFANCEFINCDFEDAHIEDCQFENSTFQLCQFDNSSFLNSKIIGTTYNSCGFDTSSNILNEFRKTTFIDTSLANCTFNFHIMKECIFKDVVLNADSIAYIFGCTYENLKNASFVFLGQRDDNKYEINEEFIQNTIELFIQKHWFLGASFMAMNFNIKSNFTCLSEVMNIILQYVKSGFLLKKDEITYFKRVLSELKNENLLPQANLINLLKELQTLIQNLNAEKNELILIDLYNHCYFLNQEIYSELESLQHCFTKDEILQVELIFKEEPNLDFAELMYRISVNQGLSLSYKEIKREKGSFLMYFEIASLLLVSFLSILKFLTGASLKVLKDFILISAILSNKDVRKRLVDKYIGNLDNQKGSVSLDNQKNTPVAIKVNVVNNIYNDASKNQELYFDILNEKKNKGYNAENILQANITTIERE